MNCLKVGDRVSLGDDVPSPFKARKNRPGVILAINDYWVLVFFHYTGGTWSDLYSASDLILISRKAAWNR